MCGGMLGFSGIPIPTPLDGNNSLPEAPHQEVTPIGSHLCIRTSYLHLHEDKAPALSGLPGGTEEEMNQALT